MKSFFSKFNVKLLVIHFIAFWLFIFAFRTLSFLYDFSFLIAGPVEARINDVARIKTDMDLVALAGLFGAITAYVISWLISLKRNWFWLNSTITFVLIYVLKLNDMLGWSTMEKVFLAPGRIFRLNTRTFYVTNGLILLGLGCYLLFSERVKAFIDGKGAVVKKTNATGKMKPAKAK